MKFLGCVPVDRKSGETMRLLFLWEKIDLNLLTEPYPGFLCHNFITLISA
jgi:hypothetical protein